MLVLMSVMDIWPMDVGMGDSLVNMEVLVRLCSVCIHMLMPMVIVMGMKVTVGEHRMGVQMAVHFAAEEEHA